MARRAAQLFNLVYNRIFIAINQNFLDQLHMVG